MAGLYFTLNGVSPLLMHNPQSMTAGVQEGLKRKEIPSPEEEAKAARYLLPDGNFYVPAIAVRNSMLSGAKGYRIGRRPAREILAGAVSLSEEIFRLVREGQAIPGEEYNVDTRRAVVQRQGIMRSRARIELPWQVECSFGYNSELANLEQIKTALNNAGQIVGLLDYRPEKGGWFGKFEVANISSE